MLIGVVSDTHGHVESTRAGLRMLESFDVGAVLHCGDIGSVAIVDLFANWPTHFVYGNVDGGSAMQAAIEKPGHHFHGRFGSLDLDGVRIALLHGDDGALLRQTIVGGQYHLVCHGHTHVARREQVGQTLVFNPGALHRANPHSIGIVDLRQLAAEVIPIH